MRENKDLKVNGVVWIASYPRSGNTFLRTMLWQCFGLRSGSIYPNDLGGNRKLEEYVGHIEHAQNAEIHFPPGSIPLVKTHEHPINDNPAIYVVRDGRAACVSLGKLYETYSITLEALMEGKHRFGTWTNHLLAWAPWERPNTLLLKYEDMRTDLPGTLEEISRFLGRDILKQSIPDRDQIAGIDGLVVRRESNWKTEMPPELLLRFNQLNEEMLKKFGYI
jgi:hypothetical protein